VVLVLVAFGMAAFSETFGTVSNGMVVLLNGAVIGFLAIGGNQQKVLFAGAPGIADEGAACDGTVHRPSELKPGDLRRLAWSAEARGAGAAS
jgi:hypothetical protein